ncbi:MAG: hypothetical protein JWO09_448 [Bacteroidetes bacterium]|nr:hypothetical protein [Bacteroidota bacterium]
MKKQFLLFILCCSFYFCSIGRIHSQTAAPALSELILSVPSITDKTYDDVRLILAGIEGVTLSGYCEQYKCFLIYYDPSKIKNGEAIAYAVQAANPSYATEVKTGASIAQLTSGCTAFGVR